MKVYVAGPMTGLPDFNRSAFHAAEKRLATLGHEVLNPARLTPADLGLDREPAWSDWMRAAIRILMDADAVCLLPGWMGSRGAYLEFQIADKLCIPVEELSVWLAERRAS